TIKLRPAKPLTQRARRFVAEYLKDLNGTEAAIRAGYSRNGARTRAYEMLRNVTVCREIEFHQQEILRLSKVSVARVAHELALMAFFDPAEMMDENGKM